MTQKNIREIENVHNSMQGLLKHVGSKYPERKWMYEPAAKYFELLYEDLVQNKPVAWYFFLLTPELFRAMDIAPFSGEYAGSVISSFPEGIIKYMELAEQHVPDSLCAINKYTLGAALSGDFPYPDMLIHIAAHPCDSASIVYPVLAEYLGVPQFCLDTPYLDDEKSHRYFASQFSKLISFLEEQTNQKLDFDRLRQVVEYSNQAQEYVLKANELRKEVPCPISSRSSATAAGAILGLAGTPFLVDWYKKQYEMALERVQRNEGALPEEKLRVAMIWSSTFFDLGVLEWMEREYGAVVVMDLLNLWINEPIEDTSSLSKIVHGLASKTLKAPMGRHGRGPVDTLLEEVVGICRDYKADVAIFAGHVGCKYGWASAKLLKDAIKEEVGIPTLFFDFDAYDPRVASSETIKAKIEQFFDTYL
ncbi:MAG: 2-hydroxyacyl-CoA dehydratase family protein [Desulfobacteria bacterium]